LTNKTDCEIVLVNESGIDVPVQENDIRIITDAVSQNENVSFHLVEVAYVGEEKIIKLNRQFLGGEYITDIITFPYSAADQFNDIEVTLTCCPGRIDEQAVEFSSGRVAEYYRVLIHGLLHVSGYDDRTEEDSALMKKRENYYLSMFNLSS
jgi:probable rRNA maturation factor